jgi:hypothetical protein
MKKIISILMVLAMISMPIFAGLNKHTYPLFNDWVYDGYNNEGEWVNFDLGALDGSLDNKQSLVRISIQVIAIDTDGSEYVTLRLREPNGNYRTVTQVSTSYNEGTKGELLAWTDEDGFLDYMIEYGWWESKKVQVIVRIENSIN